MITLKESYIDTTIYDTMKSGTPLLEYVENHGFTVNHKRKLYSVNLISVYEPNTGGKTYINPVLSTNRNAIAGMSGGPIIDYQGRVLAAMSYVYDKTGKDYSMKLDILDELIKKFNEKYN